MPYARGPERLVIGRYRALATGAVVISGRLAGRQARRVAYEEAALVIALDAPRSAPTGRGAPPAVRSRPGAVRRPNPLLRAPALTAADTEYDPEPDRLPFVLVVTRALAASRRASPSSREGNPHTWLGMASPVAGADAP
ncbi:hypothetical protein STVIR_7630 [Streptomyces viridochromogenes Tue57]|uniref:Uncharacterized protein n=1 Tax=Streptomyces viridochromogenes Tue57 TaxID=1160705 RepID=L8P1J8_STRVR|nr:hypothetical protein STVIR_7630 [Streptomyces viridochromogenes Tue57]